MNSTGGGESSLYLCLWELVPVQCGHLVNDRNVRSSGLGCHKLLLLSILAAAFSIELSARIWGLGLFMHVELG